MAEADHAEPVKMIKKGDNCVQFKESPSFALIKQGIEACCAAVQGVARTPDLPQDLSAASSLGEGSVRFLVDQLFPALRQWVAEIPLQDMANQRFGNKAFREFHAKLSAASVSLMQQFVATLPSDTAGAVPLAPGPLAVELAAYLRDSFGNAQRLDFGTGHELHFFVVILAMLRGHGALTPVDHNPDLQHNHRHLLQKATLVVFWEYMEVMRLLQKHYSLEPAGSHGVWGLDDFHHLPFIFGASQLSGFDDEDGFKSGAALQLILPKHITDADQIATHKERFLYFRCVAWITQNKRGPFHEHSSILYNVSGIDRWQRIAGGMLRMFEAEVLLKFNVVQHFLFGKLMPYGLPGSPTAPAA